MFQELHLIKVPIGSNIKYIKTNHGNVDVTHNSSLLNLSNVVANIQDWRDMNLCSYFTSTTYYCVTMQMLLSFFAHAFLFLY